MKPRAVVAMLVTVILLLSVSVAYFLTRPKPANSPATIHYTYSVVNTFLHDPGAFTEGLVYSGGFLYESTGLNGASSLRRCNLTSGEVLEKTTLPSSYFGEGITIVDNKIIQLTYTSEIGFVYDKTSFKRLGNFSYSGQGWGLTCNGKRLIMSNGSDILTFLNPETYQKTGQIQVHDGNASVFNLNELEYINGDVYANIFEQQKIVIINPDTGQVKAWLNLTGLQGVIDFNPENVLNGIAYDTQGNRLFVTGKDGPQLYEIKLTPAET